MKYATYEKYTDSPLEWSGAIPDHWQIKKIGHLVLLKSGENIVSEEIAEGGEYPVFGGNGFRGYFNQYTHEGNFVLIGRQGALCGNINYASGQFWASEHALVAHALAEFDLQWFGETLRAMNLNQYSVSAAQPGLAASAISALRLPFPPLDEQQAIARFLDAKTAQIDALVAQKRQLIDKLKEKRQALIARTVTRGLPPEAAKAAGLEPNPEMRSAEVEWLDEYPCAWSLIPLKHLAAIRYGIGEPPEYVDDGVPLIRATNVDAGFIREKGLVRVNPLDIPAKRIVWLCEGDIVVVRSGAYTADSARIPAEFAGSIAGFDMVVSPRKIESRFLAYAILSRYFKEGQLDIQKLRAAQPHLNAEELGSSAVCLPSELEQSLIADFLDRETAQIDQLIELAEGVIQSTTEYRQALITSAVTGKIDVRELA